MPGENQFSPGIFIAFAIAAAFVTVRVAEFVRILTVTSCHGATSTRRLWRVRDAG
jgi:hypothetical protein